MPESINFDYIDEDSLAVHVLEQGEKWSDKAHHDLFKTKKSSKQIETVLLFEYVDGELKRKINREKEGHGRRLKPELKMPTFTPAAMKRLIDKRNVKFVRAVNVFLNRCMEESVDPVAQLDSAYSSCIPVKPTPQPLANLENSVLSLQSGTDRPPISQLLSQLQNAEDYSGQIVQDGHRTIPEHAPVEGKLNRVLSQSLVDTLYNTKGITNFYCHQAEAINNLWDGHHVIVSTSTSSGKSLIYQVPVLHALEKDRDTRAMYIFPTKALAQDQMRSLRELLASLDGMKDIIVETFDGDTPMNERQRIREQASIIFTNPDMLHLTILPQEGSWRTFLKNLKYVVVDELHVYNGLFGSHVAYIMRRLRRVCATVGNRRSQFISCSATMANPEAHMKTIFGVKDVKLTDVDGSPNGRKEFICWNPPYVDPTDPGSGRVSTIREASKILIFLMLQGVRTIAFCKVRKACEVFVKQVRQDLEAMDRKDLMDRVMSYRGGYTPQDRRRIEQEMFKGSLLGIIATNALELGVDIGSLDAVLTIGFPYTISALRQQSGRAGRRNKDSLAMYIADPFPMDQHYMNHPEELFSMPNTELQVDLTNTLVMEGHLQCAAAEMPINVEDDKVYFGKTLHALAEDRMIKDANGFYHCHPRFLPHPSRQVGIRDTEDGHFAIIDITQNRNTVLEELEPSRANFTVYEGAIFMHQGRTFLVRELNPEKKFAKVVLAQNIEWSTRQRDYTDTDPIETEITRRIPDSPSKVFYGGVRITRIVYGFFKIDKRNNIMDAVDVDNPPIVIFTKGMWIDVPRAALALLARKRIHCAASIHSAEHALLSLLPNFVMSNEGEVRTECKVAQKENLPRESNRKRPARLTLYDAKGGASGSGLSLKAFEFIHVLLRQAIDRLVQCRCTNGCPSCTSSSLCTGEVQNKVGAGVILRMLAGETVDEDSVPMGEEPDEERAQWSISVAEEVRGPDQRLLLPDSDPGEDAKQETDGAEGHVIKVEQE
ncbi:putative DEAD/DEAH box helicase [Taphrina deformans PYCC 5710]|uniref:DEAD/DEAH box helicase n=1 Tax=Taphrina deformans (strain PYCC 5710 / ATCC 11124 / CBS 356.35 / IMI 108563 / JCM 9778 / NBRC 8474) TaxID=1097556 RepID=R4X6V4_TAPDE|nr:putative DEAD/DEAH box helicase [Taphrina deformans PYCC 5710]|eukprot:CCG80947.1 putative DEAD/DEAH box helicase [Taphrina deformans PYCC 5710]